MLKKLINYFKESRIELKKVTWPTRKQATTHTLLVIGISLGVALAFGILDYFLSLGVEKIIER